MLPAYVLTNSAIFTMTGIFMRKAVRGYRINKHNCTSKRETYLSRSAKFYYYATLLFFEMRVRSDGGAYVVPDDSAGSLCRR